MNFDWDHIKAAIDALEPTMNIRAKPGDKVIFIGENGYEGEADFAKQFFNVGETYTVAYTVIGQSYTSVGIAECESYEFNSVMFVDAPKEGEGA